MSATQNYVSCIKTKYLFGPWQRAIMWVQLLCTAHCLLHWDNSDWRVYLYDYYFFTCSIFLVICVMTCRSSGAGKETGHAHSVAIYDAVTLLWFHYALIITVRFLRLAPGSGRKFNFCLGPGGDVVLSYARGLKDWGLTHSWHCDLK